MLRFDTKTKSTRPANNFSILVTSQFADQPTKMDEMKTDSNKFHSNDAPVRSEHENSVSWHVVGYCGFVGGLNTSTNKESN